MMSFAIEVPGEAAPLSLRELGRVLEAASLSTDSTERVSATQQLRTWENNPGFFSSLQTAFLDRSLRYEIRFLAILLLKNGLEKHWRQTAKHAVSREEKEVIRSRLLQGPVVEDNRTLTLHNALVTAKIVRVDFPHDWPTVISDLLGIAKQTRTSRPKHLGGALTMILRIVKELSTARLKKSQTALQHVTPELVQMLGEIYTERTACWQNLLKTGRGDEDEVDDAMQHSLVSLKTLRRLVTAGYETPHDDGMVQGFWSLSQTQLDHFLGGVSKDSWIPARYQDLVGKHLFQFTKLHIDMCELHPVSFCMLPNSIPLVRAYWESVKTFSDVFEASGGIKKASSEAGNSRHEGPLSEKLALKGLLLLRRCVATAFQPAVSFKFKNAATKELEKRAVELIKTQLLTRDLLLELVRVIISKLFTFRQADLEAWEEEPEEWESQEQNEGQAWEWAVRPCAERLLVDLLTYYKDLSQPLLTYCSFATKVDMDTVTKEAAYCALGCAASIVRDAFDFDRFIKTNLIRDAQAQDSMAKLLRRRVAILLSQWISVRISKSSQPLVFHIFRHLLNPDDKHNDDVVRITAARQFRLIADEFEFEPEAFLAYAADFFTILTNLLEQVATEGARLAILNTIRVIVLRMGPVISQFADGIMSTLPRLWEEAADQPAEFMIKQEILAIMAALVISMGSEAVGRYGSLILPLLRTVMVLDSPLYIYLGLDAADLWRQMMEQSEPPLTAELISLLEIVLPQLGSERIPWGLDGLGAYIMLAPDAILADSYRRPVLETLHGFLNLPPDHRTVHQLHPCMSCLHKMLQGAEQLGGSQGVAVVVQDMLELGLMATILGGLHDAWKVGQTVGPRKTKSTIGGVQETYYFNFLARLAVMDPTIFATMLGAFGGLPAVWTWLAPSWFANFDSMSELSHRKLSCLALTRLTELPNPVQDLTLERLQDYLCMWTSVVGELIDGADGKPTGDLLVHDPNGGASLQRQELERPLDFRYRQFEAKDATYTIAALPYVRERLQSLVARAGGEQVFQQKWAVNVDKDVLAGFQKLGMVSTPDNDEMVA